MDKDSRGFAMIAIGNAQNVNPGDRYSVSIEGKQTRENVEVLINQVVRHRQYNISSVYVHYTNGLALPVICNENVVLHQL